MHALIALALGSSAGEWFGIILWILPPLIYIMVSKKQGKKIDGWSIPLFLIFSWFALLCWWVARLIKEK